MPFTVLLVDDDSDWLQLVSEVLVDGGYAVVTAENGERALVELERRRPVVVITDLQMPVMDGHEFLARARSKDARVPIIVLTSDGEQAAKGLPGAYRTMKKPVTVDDLYAVVSEATQHRVSRLPLAKLWSAAARTRRLAGPPTRRLGGWVQRAVSTWSAVPRRRLVAVGLGLGLGCALVLSTVLITRRLQA